MHEVTTTEINPTHNITTTESWFGKANETLNRTNGKFNLSVFFNDFLTLITSHHGSNVFIPNKSSAN